MYLKSAWVADMPTFFYSEAQSAAEARNSSSQVSVNDVSRTERGSLPSLVVCSSQCLWMNDSLGLNGIWEWLRAGTVSGWNWRDRLGWSSIYKEAGGSKINVLINTDCFCISPKFLMDQTLLPVKWSLFSNLIHRSKCVMSQIVEYEANEKHHSNFKCCY